MKIFAVLEPFFHALSDGKLIRLAVAWVLRILAVLVALAGLFWFVVFIAFGFKASESGMGTRSAGILIGCVVFSLFGLAWGYLAAGVITFRARSIMEMGDSHFTVLSIVSLLFTLNGELIFVTYSLIGVGGCLFVWLTDISPLSQLGMLGERLPFAASGSSGFMGGIELAILFLLLAFAGIVFFYALAELSVVLVEIALNTRGLIAQPLITQPLTAQPLTAQPLKDSQSAAPSITTPIPQTQPPPIPAAQPLVREGRQCKKCGQALDAGSTFCEECGTAVG